MAATTFGVVVAFSPWFADSFSLTKLLILVPGSTIALAAAIYTSGPAKVIRKRFRFRNLTSSAWPALALVWLGSLVGTAFSIDPSVSIIGRYNRYDGLVTLLGFSAFFGACAIGGTPRTGRAICFAFAAASGIAGAYGVIQSADLDPFGWNPTDGNAIVATFGNSGFASAGMGIGMVAIGAAALLTRPGLRPLWLLPFVACGATMSNTRSLGGVVALTSGGLVFLWFSRELWGRLSKSVAAALAAATLLFAIASLAFPSLPGPPGAVGRSARESFSPRLEYWKASVSAFSARPTTGWGPDTFAQIFPRHRSQNHADLHGLKSLTDKAHNTPLERFTSGGVLLGLGWLLLLFQALAAGYRPPVERRRVVLMAAGGGLVGAYAAQSLISVEVPPLAMSLWAGLGIVELTRAGVEDPGRAKKRIGPHRHPLSAISVLLAGSLITAFLARMAVADSAFLAGLKNAGDSRPVSELRPYFETAQRLNPWEPRYPAAWQIELIAAYEEGVRDSADYVLEAAEAGERAYEMEPGNPYHAYRMGYLYESLADSTEGSRRDRPRQIAADWYRRALEYDPLDPDLHRAVCLTESGKDDEARSACPPPSASARRD